MKKTKTMKKENTEILLADHGIKIHPQVKVIGMLYVTDYSKVELIEGQRPLTASGLKDIQDSMHNHGVLTAGIAVRNPDKKGFYLIPDGQTRIHGAKTIESDMVFILVEPDCSVNELMIVLNTTQHNWSTEAYLNNGIEFHGNTDMEFLGGVWEDEDLSLTALYEIYAYDIGVTQAKLRFENGTWSASTKNLGNKVLKYADELNELMPFSLNAKFLTGFVKCVSKPAYDQKHMISQAKRFKMRIHECASPTEYRKMLDSIYNHRCLDELQVVLY